MRIINNQSWLDISLQETGTLGNVFDIALANGVSITDIPVVGEKALITGTAEKRKLAYLKERGIVIGTMGGLISSAGVGGIGHWAIEVDFIVS